MNLRHRAITLLLSVVMVLTFMPALAFADDTPASGGTLEAAEELEGATTVKPVSFEYDAVNPLEEYIGKEFVELYVPGNKVKINYSNGTSKTYIAVEDEEEGVVDFYRLNADGSVGTGVMPGEIYAYTIYLIEEGSNECVIWYTYGSYELEARGTVYGIADHEISDVHYTQVKPCNINYKDLCSDPYSWRTKSKYYMGDKVSFTASFEDEDGASETDTNTYTYGKDPDDDYSYFYVDEEGEPAYAEVDIVPDSDPNKWLPGGSYTATAYVNGVPAPEKLSINVTGEAAVPYEVIFNPAEGFVPTGDIGDKELWSFYFDGEGNSFTVKYSDGTEKTYIYATHPDGYGAFFLNGDTSKKEFDCYGEVKGGLKKGLNEVTFTYEEYIKAYDDYVTVDFTAGIEAAKYVVYMTDKAYKYTGKYITPTIVVKNSAGKTLVKGTPATETEPATGDYYVEYVKHKKVGRYLVKIYFNDGLEDRELYPDSTEGYYSIKPPKAPVIKSVTGGKKSLTVKWKKFTKAQRKHIDGFYIEVATDKNFYSNYKCIQVRSRTAASKTIKGLKKGKKYYVRMCAYKNVTPEGSSKTYKMPVCSSNSKRKYVKTK